jgi:hypothetical protein
VGFKLQGALRCGACGKPRGLGAHACSPGKRRRRTTLTNPVSWECGNCGKPRGVRHTCRQRSDFKARKRKAATDERRRKRKAMAAARADRRKRAAFERRDRDHARKQAAKDKKRRARPKVAAHEPGTCGNRECPKYACRAYWAGMEACPLPHQGPEQQQKGE